MRVNHTTKRAASPQLRLFETRGVGSLGACRYHVGNYFEQRTAQYYDAVQLATTGGKGDYCPDIYRERDAQYYECKSVGNNGAVITYEGRLLKDKEFCDGGHCLDYVAWRHCLDLKAWRERFETIPELDFALSMSLRSHARVEFLPLYTLCMSMRVRRLSTATTCDGKRLGYGQEGYGVGWTVNYNKLLSIAAEVVQYEKPTL